MNATRTESRWIHQRINDLNRQKNSFEEELHRFDEQILKKQRQIEKIVEQYQSLSIKTTMIGQDKDNNEFWFFKDEPSKLFIKKYEESKDPQWYFIDEEVNLEHLFESLNPKGIKEKKLQENLKKIRVSLKLRKAKQPKTSSDSKPEEEKKDATDADGDASMEDEEKKEDDENEDKTEDNTDSVKHHLFENDNYEQTIINATWYNKSMPKRRGNYMVGMRGTRGRLAK